MTPTVKDLTRQLEQIHGQQTEVSSRLGSLEAVAEQTSEHVADLVACIKGEEGLLVRTRLLEHVEEACGGPKAVSRHALHIKGLWAALTILASAAGASVAWAATELLPHVPVLQELAVQLRRLNGDSP